MFSFLFETEFPYSPRWPRNYYVAENDLESLIFLPSFSKCWDYRCVHVCVYDSQVPSGMTRAQGAKPSDCLSQNVSPHQNPEVSHRGAALAFPWDHCYPLQNCSRCLWGHQENLWKMQTHRLGLPAWFSGATAPTGGSQASWTTQWVQGQPGQFIMTLS